MLQTVTPVKTKKNKLKLYKIRMKQKIDFKIGLSPFSFFLLASMIALQNLFHLKTSFHSLDIHTLVLTFWASTKKSLILKLRLISKLMTSQPG